MVRVSAWIAISNLGDDESCTSCNDKRQTGQVRCFNSHLSMHVTWNAWPHFGKNLKTSLSWYSPKQMQHLMRGMHMRNSKIANTLLFHNFSCQITESFCFLRKLRQLLNMKKTNGMSEKCLFQQYKLFAFLFFMKRFYGCGGRFSYISLLVSGHSTNQQVQATKSQ